MKIEDDQKINVLLALLNERYNASHKMRERSFKFALWIFGLLIGGGSWILLNGSTLTIVQKAELTVILSLTSIFTFWFIQAIKKGFDTNWTVTVKIEESIQLYDKGVFLDSESLFPESYKNAGRTSMSSHFITLYVWLASTLIVLLLMIWFSSFVNDVKPPSDKVLNEKKLIDSVIINNTVIDKGVIDE